MPLSKYINFQKEAKHTVRDDLYNKIKPRVLQELDDKDNWTKYGCLVTYDYNNADNEIYRTHTLIEEVCDEINKEEPNSDFYLSVKAFTDVEKDFQNSLRYIFTKRFPTTSTQPCLVAVVINRKEKESEIELSRQKKRMYVVVLKKHLDSKFGSYLDGIQILKCKIDKRDSECKHILMVMSSDRIIDDIKYAFRKVFPVIKNNTYTEEYIEGLLFDINIGADTDTDICDLVGFISDTESCWYNQNRKFKSYY